MIHQSTISFNFLFNLTTSQTWIWAESRHWLWWWLEAILLPIYGIEVCWTARLSQEMMSITVDWPAVKKAAKELVVSSFKMLYRSDLKWQPVDKDFHSTGWINANKIWIDDQDFKLEPKFEQGPFLEPETILSHALNNCLLAGISSGATSLNWFIWNKHISYS